MPNFNYTALNSEKKMVSGSIESPSLEDAKKELHEEALSIIDINEGEKTETKEGQNHYPEFQFEAKNRLGKKVAGVIEGQNMFSAYKKLRLEHHFKVISIFDAKEKNKEIENAEKENSAFLMEERLKKELNFFESLSKLSPSGFSKEILSNLKHLDKIKQENLNIQQKRILKSIKYIYGFFSKVSQTHRYFIFLVNQIMKKIYPFLFFSSLFFGLVFVFSNLSIEVLGIYFPENILTNRDFRLFSCVSIVGFFAVSLNIFLFRKLRVFFTYFSVLLWFFGSLVLFYNV